MEESTARPERLNASGLSVARFVSAKASRPFRCIFRGRSWRARTPLGDRSSAHQVTFSTRTTGDASVALATGGDSLAARRFDHSAVTRSSRRRLSSRSYGNCVVHTQPWSHANAKHRRQKTPTRGSNSAFSNAANVTFAIPINSSWTWTTRTKRTTPRSDVYE